VASDLLLAIGSEPGHRSPVPRTHPGPNRGPRHTGLRGNRGAHSAAAPEWGAAAPGSFDYLKGVSHPALVVNGSNDIVVPTINSYILQQNLPNAELILFPDSNHGWHFQFQDSFIEYVTSFINH
jgi:pimeloyl-ACP methyl ester carboxylesterase